MKIREKEPAAKNPKTKAPQQRKYTISLNYVFSTLWYVLLGIDASLLLLTAGYWYLDIYARSAMLLPAYHTFYTAYNLITILSCVFFGIDIIFLAYVTRLQKKTKRNSILIATIIGCLIFFVSLLGITHHFQFLPIKGLKFKTISLLFFIFPIIFMKQFIFGKKIDINHWQIKNLIHRIFFYVLLLIFITILCIFYSLLHQNHAAIQPVIQHLQPIKQFRYS